MKIKVTESIYNAIQEHGSETFPYECCGFLYGRITKIDRIVTNLKRQNNESRSSREKRFLITPESYKNAEDYADSVGVDLLGFYHSHPDSPAIPSQYDLEHAWPWFSYLILSVTSGKPAELLAWQLKEDRSGFEKVILQIMHEEA